MPISNKFQKRFNSLIDELDCKRSELAILLNVNLHTLSNTLVYGIVPTTKILVRIADYFNVSIKYLLGETDDNDFIKSVNPTTFSDRFTSLCQEKNVSHYEVSKKCYFDKSNVSRWLSRGYYPTLDILEQLCLFFNVSLDYILGRTDFKN